MEIALHIGANCTEGERLLKSLQANTDRFAVENITVPSPNRYRSALREAVLAEVRGLGSQGAHEALLKAMLAGRQARRLILSNPALMALPALVFDKGFFFSTAAAKVQAVGDIFADEQVELFLTIRNPATWIPAVRAQAGNKSYQTLMGGVDPRRVRWSELIRRLHEAVPEAPITVWCNEDAPLVWGEILARLAGLPPEHALEGRYDMMGAIMVEEGLDRFEKYMVLHPNQGLLQERRVIGAFLDKYAIAEKVEEEVDLPGWDEALVEDLTRAYEEDVGKIATIEGVTLVTA